MNFTCNECNDTGSIDKSGDYLDCTSCEAPAERMALESFIEKLPAMGGRFQVWRVHQRALAMVPKQEAPAGWKLVPEDPTGDMFRAAAKIDNEMFAGGSSHGAEDGQVWAAMYDAAPEAPIAAPAAANGTLTDEREMFDRMYLSMHSFHTKAELDKEWHRTGAMFCAALAAGPDAALVALIHKAQSILAQHLPPDGPDAKTTISALLGLLDGPESRAALSGAKGN